MQSVVAGGSDALGLILPAAAIGAGETVTVSYKVGQTAPDPGVTVSIVQARVGPRMEEGATLLFTVYAEPAPAAALTGRDYSLGWLRLPLLRPSRSHCVAGEVGVSINANRCKKFRHRPTGEARSSRSRPSCR